MSQDSALRVIFIVSNVGITLGYMFIAAFIAPHFKVRLWRTRLGGIVFFVTCALTHLEMAAHAAFEPRGSWADMFTSWHMMIIHAVQVASIWSFVTGLYREFVLPGRSIPQGD